MYVSGIPCSHIFAVLKLQNAVTIPDSCILKRWTKDAKKDPAYISRVTPDDVESAILVKRAQLAGICNKLAFFASRASEDGYLEMKEKIGALTVRAAELFEEHQSMLQDMDGGREHCRIIRDPIRVTGKKSDASKKRKDKIRKRSRKKAEVEEASQPAMAIVKAEPQTEGESIVNMITSYPSQHTASYPHPASSSSPFQSYSVYANSTSRFPNLAQPVNPSACGFAPNFGSFQYMLQCQMVSQRGDGLSLGHIDGNYFIR